MLLLTLLSMVFGATDVDAVALLLRGISGDISQSTPQELIVWQIRLPRALLAALVGAALAVSGGVFQGMFRNPLADPFVIGAASGAALGAALVVVVGQGSLAGHGVQFGAFVGCIATVMLVLVIGQAGRNVDAGLSLLLAGVAVATLVNAAVSMLMLLDEQGLRVVFTWLLGGFGGRGWSHLAVAAPYLLLSMAAMFALSRKLDAMALGDDAAESLGLSTARNRILMTLVAAVATASAVSVAGIVGFVGLLAPHAARMLVGGAHGLMLPVAALLGAALLQGADIVARVALAPVEVPIGIITALLGGPFFLALLFLHQRRGGL